MWTYWIATKEQALAIHFSLIDRVRALSKVWYWFEETGGKKHCFFFFSDKGHRQFTTFHSLYNLHSLGSVNIDEPQHMYFKFIQKDMKLPEPVMAFIM